jgi:hypothetical protein
MVWVETISGSFSVLVIISLVWLTLGFALDSTQNRQDVEDAPSSRPKLLGWCLGWTVLSCFWLAGFVNEWADPAPDWWMVSMAAIWTLLAAAHALQAFRAARLAT